MAVLDAGLCVCHCFIVPSEDVGLIDSRVLRTTFGSARFDVCFSFLLCPYGGM